MRILIDECVDPRVKQLFGGHDVATVRDRGWGAMEDGPLLAAAQEQFDLFITNDRGIEFQQNLAKFRIGVVVVHVPKNQIGYYRAIRAELQDALTNVRLGEVIHIAAPPA
jgi:predicted nuclease of predicted toxin-antitoxin system